MRRTLLVAAVAFGLVGCAGQDVIGTGSGTDEYKASPCACGRPDISMPNVRHEAV